MDNLKTMRSNKLQAALEEVRQIFSEQPKLYLWIKNYSITHGTLEVVVHKGNFLEGYRIICGDCYYISGLTSGGPYHLEIKQTFEGKNEWPQITIVGDDDKLVIKCTRISSPEIRNVKKEAKRISLPPEVESRLSHFKQALQ